VRYEVENKFPVADIGAVEKKLSSLGADFKDAVTQVDTYFAHPIVDYHKTDEALRIRSVGDNNFLTYKGPKIDTETKTRREIDLPVGSGVAAARELSEILSALGFRAMQAVVKRRREVSIEHGGITITGALDEVDGLGTFVELEIVADAGQVEPAKANIAELAGRLGLSNPERRSYLELLLEKPEAGM